MAFWFAGESFGPQSESAGTADASFSLHDVLENSVYYFQSVHESIEPTSDVFSFYVSDGFSRSEVQSVNVTIQVRPALSFRAHSGPLAHELCSLRCDTLEEDEGYFSGVSSPLMLNLGIWCSLLMDISSAVVI